MRRLSNGSCAGLLGDREAAQDVTQNTFLKLLTRLDRYVPGEAPFEAWLFRVARNAAHDELRRRRMTVATELREHDAAVHEDGSLRTGVLVDALAALPPAQQQALLLRHVVGLSAHEVRGPARAQRTGGEQPEQQSQRGFEGLACEFARRRESGSRAAASRRGLISRREAGKRPNRPATGLRHIVPIAG